MTPFEEAMAAPRIEVIDAAIARIELGLEVFTCRALKAAVYAAFPEIPSGEIFVVWLRYGRQYEASCRRDGARPWWWNSVTAGPGPRLRALRRFRQLCLDAAK